MRAATADELVGAGPSGGRQTSLDGHAAYLTARSDECCTSANVLHLELAERGLTVSERTVRRFVHRLRDNGKPATARPSQRSAR
jgi:transposase